MKAISLMQPWAGLLVLGIKGFETRSWNTKHRGPLAVHASAKTPKEGYELLEWLNNQFPSQGYRKGHRLYEICTVTSCILGQVDLVSTHESASTFPAYSFEEWRLEQKLGDWTPGRWVWNCQNPVLYDVPIPAKGALSIWNWEKEA